MMNKASTCQQCGMLVEPATSYHPFAACLMFKGCNNGNRVQANLDAVVAYGKSRVCHDRKLERALEQIASGRIFGDEGNFESTVAVMRDIAQNALDEVRGK